MFQAKKIAAICISGAMLLGTTLPAQAGLIAPSQVYGSSQATDRSDLHAFFDRADVQTELQALGVDPKLAKDRVNHMSDAEVALLRDRIADEPAGAGVIGALFSVFVILLVTDILGLTKVFPFTRSVR